MTLAEMQTPEAKKKSDPQSLRAKIKGFCGDPLIIERLRELGLHHGLEVQAVGRAPFGGPQLFRFGNTVLALRREEAQCTLIEIL